MADFGQSIQDGDYGLIQSFVVVRNGYLVFERYANGGYEDAPASGYSVTKSVTSLVIGAAQDQGLLGSLDVSVMGYFPEYPVVEYPAPEKGAITLEHVLQMRTGLGWDEWTIPYTEPENPTTLLAQSSDWIKHVLDLPMVSSPGSEFQYNSGATMLLSGVLRNEAGRPADEYAEEVLLGPLGAEGWSWQMGPDDVANTGWGLSLSARDMARIGYLVVVDGEWNGRRIVPVEWIEASVRPHTEFPNGEGYGYQWWIGPPVEIGGESVRPISARGWGDQYIVVVPSAGLVLVATGRNLQGSRLSAADLAALAADAVTP